MKIENYFFIFSIMKIITSKNIFINYNTFIKRNNNEN